MGNCSVSNIHSCSHCERLLLDVYGSGGILPDFLRLPLNKLFQTGVIATRLSFRDIRKGASKGCSLFMDLLKDCYYASRDVDLEKIVGIEISHSDTIGISEIRFRAREAMATSRKESWQWISIKTYLVYTLEGDPANNDARRKPPNLDPNSKPSFDTARKWLRNCRKNHPGCSPQASLRLPARLLDITGNFEKNDSSVRLIPVSAPSEYAALSYCWGGDQPCKLRKATLQGAQTVILMDQLPQTIKDAIRVAREFELTFLWIDCLCIVQDDVEEVAREIDKMSEIFQGAVVTISAASASGSSEGFLQARTPTGANCPQFKLPFRSSDNRHGTILLSPSSQQSIPDPIDFRAWTLQEHILSSRIVCYGSQQLYWICRKGRCNYGGVELTRNTMAIHGPIKQAYALSKESWHLPSPDATWDYIVGSFTARKLSNPSDKLVAISAIAKEFSYLKRTKYIAGLWEKTLFRDLVWHRTPSSTPQPRPKTYRAPSWSWAAIDSEVSLNSWRSEKSKLDLLYWEVHPTSIHSPHGAVDSAHIKVRSRMTMAKLTDGGKNMIIPMPQRKICVKEEWGRLSRPPWWCLDAIETELEGVLDASVWLLEVFCKQEKYGPKGLMKMDGLILQPGKNPDEFMRIGKFCFEFEGLRDGKASRENDVFQRRTVTIV